ncbi:MAG: DUF2304 domain-containing protein [Acidimicrobiia bacterium]
MTMPNRLELTALTVAVGFLAFILMLVRRRQLREKYAVLWLGVGVFSILLTLARPLLDRVSLALGIAYGPSTLFLFSTVFLMAVAAHLSWEVSRLEERTRRLAEEIALLRVEAVDPPPSPVAEIDR